MRCQGNPALFFPSLFSFRALFLSTVVSFDSSLTRRTDFVATQSRFQALSTQHTANPLEEEEEEEVVAVSIAAAAATPVFGIVANDQLGSLSCSEKSGIAACKQRASSCSLDNAGTNSKPSCVGGTTGGRRMGGGGRRACLS